MEHEGILMTLNDVCVIKFGVPTKNGHIYLARNFNLEDPEIQERLATHTLFGVVNLPPDFMGMVNIKDAAFCITSLYKKEDGLYADLDVIDTPAGRDLKTAIDVLGCDPKVSPVGTGDLNCDNTIENYHIDTFEIVGMDS